MDPRLRRAVDANVGWYDDLCVLHGVGSTLEHGLWVSSTSPPPLHSDAVVVEPGVSAQDVLDRLAERPQCGVKDSFATLDLSGGRMRVLFDASWIHHEGSSSGTPSTAWGAVTTAAELATWTALHDTTGVLLPGLLSQAHFTVLARYDGGQVVAGAVARLGSGVVDVSNTYAVPGHRLDWPELVTVVSSRFPGRPLVGYTRGEELGEAVEAGFTVVGDLRVWVR
jgi:hypothetical protein